MPVSKKWHNYWCILQQSKGSGIHCIIKKWWFFVKVSEEISFGDIEVEQSKKCDRKQDRQGYTVGKSYEDEVDDNWISKVNISFWACIKVYVILNRYAFCVWLFIKLRFPAINESRGKFNQVYRSKVYKWHHRLYHHCLHNLITDHIVPIQRKITKLILNWQKA